MSSRRRIIFGIAGSASYFMLVILHGAMSVVAPPFNGIADDMIHLLGTVVKWAAVAAAVLVVMPAICTSMADDRKTVVKAAPV